MFYYYVLEVGIKPSKDHGQRHEYFPIVFLILKNLKQIFRHFIYHQDLRILHRERSSFETIKSSLMNPISTNTHENGQL
jgi:hypothetical protein